MQRQMSTTPAQSTKLDIVQSTEAIKTHMKYLLLKGEAYCSSYEVFSSTYKHRRVNLDKMSWPKTIINPNPKLSSRFYSNVVWFLLYEAEQGRYK